MTLVNGSMGKSGKSGKCSNFGNCSLADARKTVDVPAGLDFVCTECGKPLLLTDAGTAAGSSKALLVGALLLLVVLAAGGIAWSLFAGKKTAASPAVPVPQATAPAPVTKPQMTPEINMQAKPGDTPQPPPSLSGNCSDADAKAGLCQAKP